MANLPRAPGKPTKEEVERYKKIDVFSVEIPKTSRRWDRRKMPGRGNFKIFESPKHLWDRCCDYFEWVEKNPLLEVKTYMYQGSVVTCAVPKLRIMTKTALYVHLMIDQSRWEAYRARPDYEQVCLHVESIIRTQKMEGGAAELFNPMIVARSIGLRDAQDIKATATTEVKTTDAQQLGRQLNYARELMSKLKEEERVGQTIEGRAEENAGDEER